MGVAETSQSNAGIELSGRGSRPALIYGTLFTISLVILSYFDEYIKLDAPLFPIYLMTVVMTIPAILYENKVRYAKTPALIRLRFKMERYRSIFFTGGFIFSFFSMVVSIILTYSMVSYIDPEFIETHPYYFRNVSWIYLLIILSLVYLLSYIYGLMFFRIKSFDTFSHQLKYHIQSPLEIFALMSYFIIPLYLIPALLWIGTSAMNYYSPISSILGLDHIFLGASALLIMIPATCTVGILQAVSQYRVFVREDDIRLDLRTDFRPIIVRNFPIIVGLVVLGILFAFYPLVSADIRELLFRVSIGSIPIYFLYKYFRSDYNDSICDSCSLVKPEDDCANCDAEPQDTIVSQKLREYYPFGKIKQPKCPNCKTPWDTLDRQCRNCNYSILLICENCSKTINPLWKNCARCNHILEPVPLVALHKTSTKFLEDKRGKFLLLTLFCMYIVLLQALGIVNFVNRVIERQIYEIYGVLPIDTGVMLLSFLILAIASFIIYYVMGDQNRKPVVTILSYVIFMPIAILFLTLSFAFLSFFFISDTLRRAILFDDILFFGMVFFIILASVFQIRSIKKNMKHSSAVIPAEDHLISLRGLQ